MTAREHTMSHHLLRRTARRKQRQLERIYPGDTFRIEKAERGPWRWRVVLVG